MTILYRHLLEEILRNKQDNARTQSHTWQSYNLKREQAAKRLNDLKLH